MMKALVKIKKGEEGVELQKKPEPVTEAHWVKVKVKAAGICGTDLHIVKDEYPVNPPVTMGHEYAGEIVEVGEGVVRFQKGDRVVSLTAIKTCGVCSYCKRGLVMLCSERESIGSGVDGAFSEYIVVPASSVYNIPEHITFEEAALTEPLACVVRCVMERNTVAAGDSVLISGPGTMGMLALQVAKAHGGEVTVIGTSADQERLALATELGASQTVNVEDAEQLRMLERIEAQQGFDVAIECAGVGASFNNCIHLLKKQGRLIQLGLFGQPISFHADTALMKEIQITNGFATTPYSWELALKLLELNKLKLKPLISNKIPLQHWEEAFRLAEGKSGFKTLLIP